MENGKILIQSTNNRRNFIKQLASVGGVLGGSLLSNSLSAKNISAINAKSKTCDFSNLAADFTYLNSGTEGSMPRCVIDQLSSEQQRWASDPTTAYEADKVLGKHQHFGRSRVAKSLLVKKDNLCFTDNTTMGLNMVLMGINFTASDKVILTNHEHNAIVSPLSVQQHKTGLKVIKRNFPAARQLSKMNAEQIVEALFPNTKELQGAKALCVSHVYPTTGIRLPLDLLRRKADQLGIQYLIVDGAQAFGMIDLSVGVNAISHADFYACPGHKWLNGPPSTGILYIKDENIQPPEFYPTMSQRMSQYVRQNDLVQSSFPMAEALQVRGCSNTPGFSAMQTAIDFQKTFGGFSSVEKQIISLSSQVKTFISSQAKTALVSPSIDNRTHSGLTVFFPFSWQNPQRILTDKKTADQIVVALLKKKIQIRSIGFQNSPDKKNKVYALRVSTGIFNTQKHIDRFKQSLRSVLQEL